LHNSVNGEEINSLFQENNETLDELTKILIETAKVRDGSDNITVAIAKIKENSNDAQQIGISTTIAEEDAKVLPKEDRLIQDQYDDAKLKLVKKTRKPSRKKRNIMVAGLLLTTTFFGFVLGMFFQSTKLNSNTQKLPVFSGNVNASAIQTQTSKDSGAMVAAAQASKTETEHPIDQQLIQRSKVSQDAVLTFVFFNSSHDYKQAMLEERVMVLDRLFPYIDERNEDFNGNFWVFLIDSSNNVLRQTKILLPAISQD
jgi:hypothetical protein